MSYKYYADKTSEKRLTFVNGHVFANINDREWLIDTGAPTSFGLSSSLEINGHEFKLHNNYMGLSAKELSMHTGHVVYGLIGTDILNQFNIIMDYENESIAFSNEDIVMSGTKIPMHAFMGIPIINVKIEGQDRKMFFDTGAQISYWHGNSINAYESIDTVKDFYPGFGKFETKVYSINIELEGKPFNIRCGVLPKMLEMSLSMGGTEGIIGNEIIKNRIVGYFPKKDQIIIS
jgi:hypothetical protein